MNERIYFTHINSDTCTDTSFSVYVNKVNYVIKFNISYNIKTVLSIVK